MLLWRMQARSSAQKIIAKQKNVECDDAALWDESMLEELSACIENGTWTTVSMATLPPYPNIVKTKWIYK